MPDTVSTLKIATLELWQHVGGLECSDSQSPASRLSRHICATLASGATDHTILAAGRIEACEKIIARFLLHQTYLLIDRSFDRDAAPRQSRPNLRVVSRVPGVCGCLRGLPSHLPDGW